MKLAIVSDTHIGDERNTFVGRGANGDPVDGRNFNAFCKAVGKGNDYLILAGDIMDFAVRDYKSVYEQAEYFFNRVKDKGLARNIVYVPGNHDYNIWDTIEYQANVINQIRDGQPVRKFKMTVPLIIDCVSSEARLINVKAGGKKNPYGGMFLDDLIKKNKPGKPGYIPFLVAYPNVYIKTESAVILVTHGQYLESYWSLASRMLMDAEQRKGGLSMKDYISANFPLCQLGSSGIGQAGPLTAMARQIEQDVQRGYLKNVKRYIKRVIPYLINEFRLKLIPCLRWGITRIIVSMIIKGLEKIQNTDYMSDLIESRDKDLMAMFNLFMDSSVDELNSLRVSGEFNIADAVPDIFIFGHTHVPYEIPDSRYYSYCGKRILLLNTGGWLEPEKDVNLPQGGVVFKYETGGEVKSVRI